MAKELGPHAQLLDITGVADVTGPHLVAEWDACWIDGAPIRHVAEWRTIIDSGRLDAVTGAFVLAWRDAADGALHLARDAIGERTLYYAWTGTGVAFASSVRALLATGLVAPAIDRAAVGAYLCFAYVPGQQTLVEGVLEVLPGEHIRVQDGKVRRDRIWQLAGDSAGPLRAAATTKELRRRLALAVQRRLPGSEPVAASLSGGIDSSLVVALAARLHHLPIETFSVSFGSRYPNELQFSSMVAAHCNTAHHIVEMPARVIVDHVDEAIGMLSKPIGDPLTVPNALLFREAATHAAIVLNGEGGDPCFGGPKNIPMVLATLYGDGGGDAPTAELARSRDYLRAHRRFFDDLDQMLTDDVQEALRARPVERIVTPLLSDPRWTTLVNRLMAANLTLKGGHHILPKVDQLSQPFGVSPRSPLFDRDVVDIAFAFPADRKLCGTLEKLVLKQAVSHLLPKSIIDRPKSGMRVPVEAWFNGPLRRGARERLLDGLTQYGLVRRDYVEALLCDGQARVPRRGVKIWALIALEAWLRTVLNTGQHAPPRRGVRLPRVPRTLRHKGDLAASSPRARPPLEPGYPGIARQGCDRGVQREGGNTEKHYTGRPGFGQPS
jgi:asparagine synthase (glutamine-hydrolysing)